MFEDTASLAPFSGEIFHDALRRVLAHPLVPEILRVYFPGISADQLAPMANAIRNADELQKAFVDPFIRNLLAKTSAGLTIGGAERLRPGETYLFLSNHRDIVLDPGLFAWALFRHGLRTPDICLGDNLLGDQWVMNLMKLNKGVTVKRSASSRELLRWSQALSEYIRTRITSRAESVWLAQREGRAKDGDDRTQPGVLKMLSLSGEGSLPEKLAALRLVPVAISYEYLPCDALIAREQFLTERDGSYQKHEREDADSMRRSFGGWKGGIRIEVAEPDFLSGRILSELAKIPNRNEQTRGLACLIDERLHRLYHLWPSNHIACDLLEDRVSASAEYSAEARDQFIARMEKRIAEVTTDPGALAGIRRHFLRLYATPVLNRRKLAVSPS